MKKLTRMVETTYAYEAADGTKFYSEEECLKYEKSAYVVARSAAQTYEVNSVCDPCLFPGVCGGEDTWVVYRVPNVTALEVINTYLKLRDIHRTIFIDPECVGSEVLVQFYEYDECFEIHGTYDQFLEKCINSARYAFGKLANEQEVTEA